MPEITFRENKLILESKSVQFDYAVRNLEVIGEQAIVLLAIPNDDNTVDNIFSFSFDGVILWRVQSIKEKFPEINNVLPYENMIFDEDKLSASDFYGRRFFIDTNNGKLISKDFVK